MRTIWKYELKQCELQELEVPLGSHPLCVQLQGDVPQIWFEVETTAPMSQVEVYTFGTGEPIFEDFDGEYIGTYQLFAGMLIWHVYLKFYD